MFSKKPKLAFTALLGCFLAAAVFTTACNNEAEKKEPAADTATAKPAEPVVAPTPAPADTTKKDTLSDRPVKTPD
ncbi:MAG: hypothetical protein JNK27_15365 [Chitinophagaceae bacterium]|nr:hypothetical protein [Chitinophagaceae bacterium]